MDATGTKVMDAKSMSPDWQITGTEVGEAPSWEGEGGLMVRVGGVGLDSGGGMGGGLGDGGGKRGRGGEGGMRGVEELVRGFERRMEGLRKVVEAGERDVVGGKKGEGERDGEGVGV